MEYVLAAIAFLAGCVLAILLLVGWTFRCYEFSVGLIRADKLSLLQVMQLRVDEFTDVTKKASEANLTLGKAVADFDRRMQEVENRMNMLNLRVNSKG